MKKIITYQFSRKISDKRADVYDYEKKEIDEEQRRQDGRNKVPERVWKEVDICTHVVGSPWTGRGTPSSTGMGREGKMNTNTGAGG